MDESMREEARSMLRARIVAGESAMARLAGVDNPAVNRRARDREIEAWRQRIEIDRYLLALVEEDEPRRSIYVTRGPAARPEQYPPGSQPARPGE